MIGGVLKEAWHVTNDPAQDEPAQGDLLSDDELADLKVLLAAHDLTLDGRPLRQGAAWRLVWTDAYYAFDGRRHWYLVRIA